ncbi:unnamed protein product [Caenorhabditis bovis]|uniref:F-box domain-containing protein n=1 Tax=Caenorhabditis bovis TaxID=2654633 RepID=A0A8S1EEK5_9PELO|nr:unnamed protein product [Caenorhabditis bovis]
MNRVQYFPCGKIWFPRFGELPEAVVENVMRKCDLVTRTHLSWCNKALNSLESKIPCDILRVEILDLCFNNEIYKAIGVKFVLEHTTQFFMFRQFSSDTLVSNFTFNDKLGEYIPSKVMRNTNYHTAAWDFIKKITKRSNRILENLGYTLIKMTLPKTEGEGSAEDEAKKEEKTEQQYNTHMNDFNELQQEIDARQYEIIAATGFCDLSVYEVVRRPIDDFAKAFSIIGLINELTYVHILPGYMTFNNTSFREETFCFHVKSWADTEDERMRRLVINGKEPWDVVKLKTFLKPHIKEFQLDVKIYEKDVEKMNKYLSNTDFYFHVVQKNENIGGTVSARGLKLTFERTLTKMDCNYIQCYRFDV